MPSTMKSLPGSLLLRLRLIRRIPIVAENQAPFIGPIEAIRELDRAVAGKRRPIDDNVVPRRVAHNFCLTDFTIRIATFEFIGKSEQHACPADDLDIVSSQKW